MRAHKRLVWVCGLTACAVLAVAAVGEAAVVTARLGTGLPPRGPREDLPRSWAAPVDEAPTIDGRLDEKSWTATRPVVLGTIERHGKASPQTEARCLHRGGFLYVGVKLAEPAIAKLKRTATGTDGPAWQDDSVELFLQPHADRDYFQIVVSASGAIFDRIGHGQPSDWDSGTKAAVAVDKDGWSMEVAVPMAALDVGESIPSRWRVNVYRNRRAGGQAESQAWSPTMSGDYDVPERFGHLLFTPESPWAPEEEVVNRPLGIEVEQLGEEEAVLQFDLSSLPEGTRICRARLRCERDPIEGDDPRALKKVEIYPLGAPYRKSAAPRAEARPLALVPPWYRSFDMTELVRGWVAGKPNNGVYVKTFPGWQMDKTYLDLIYEGEPANVPQQVRGLKAVHRAGLTFITWQELEEPFKSKLPTLDELKAALAKMEAARQVRYRIFRHRIPIDKKTIVEAELLAEVGPLSAYNTRGVSVDHVIHQRQLRAIADGTYARSIAQDPFKVSPESPEMGAVPVRRLAIEDGKPLAAGRGLYVHQPEKAGKAYYAVVTCVDGVANMVDLGADSSLPKPVSEEVGTGEPVFQNVENLKAFYDYPGQRRHYVQWCSPAKANPQPLANLPNQHYNWSVYVPPGAAGKKPLALGIYFHDWRGLYLRPRWPHEADQILIATNDAPWPSFGYGYHESLGTLKSFGEGVVHDYTAARIDAFVAWVREKYNIDPARFSCHGSGTLGGTAAVHYGLRHAEQVAWIVAGYFDPDPGTCPATVQSGDRALTTHLPKLEAVWGKREWNLKTAAGVSTWKDRDLTSLVRGSPDKRLPFFSIGTGTLSAVWRQQVPWMKALLESRQPLVAAFDWGGSPPPYAPEYVRRDQLIPAVQPEKMKFAEGDIWTEAKVHYSSGGSINTGVTWKPESVVDTPDRLELEGQFNGTVTFRNVQRFKPKPGERVTWTVETGPHGQKSTGEVTVDRDGLITIAGVRRGKIVITRVNDG